MARKRIQTTYRERPPRVKTRVGLFALNALADGKSKVYVFGSESESAYNAQKLNAGEAKYLSTARMASAKSSIQTWGNKLTREYALGARIAVNGQTGEESVIAFILTAPVERKGV